MRLHNEAGVEVNEFGNTLEDVNIFAKHLGIQINIADGDNFNKIIHTSEEESVAGRMIYLYKNSNYFVRTTTVTLVKRHTNRDKHKCPTKCLACFKSDSKCKDSGLPSIVCDKCNRTFFGQSCFNEHKRDRGNGDKRDVVCELVQKCVSCKRTVHDLKKHICGYSQCSNCNVTSTAILTPTSAT